MFNTQRPETRRRPVWRHRRGGRARKLTVVTGMIVVMAFLTAPSITQTPPDGATKFIQGLGDQLLNTLAHPQSALSRDVKVRRLLSENLHLPLIGRYVMGTAWRQATEDQRREYLDLFSPWVLHRYSRQLGNQTGRSIRITGAKPARGEDVLITTQITGGAFQPVHANWRVRAVEGGYKVVDVMVDGASFALSQRLEFAGVVKRHGITGLLARLRAQVTRFQAQRS